MKKIVLLLSALLFMSINTQSSATKRNMIKLFKNITRRFCRAFIPHQKDFWEIPKEETISCEDCILGGKRKGYDPFIGSCGKFKNREQKESKALPLDSKNYKKVEI